jgi:hypothetical protein
MTATDREAELRELARDLAYVADLRRGRGLLELADALETVAGLARGATNKKTPEVTR